MVSEVKKNGRIRTKIGLAPHPIPNPHAGLPPLAEMTWMGKATTATAHRPLRACENSRRLLTLRTVPSLMNTQIWEKFAHHMLFLPNGQASHVIPT